MNTDTAPPSIAQIALVLQPLQELQLLDLRGTYANSRSLTKCGISPWDIEVDVHVCR